MSKKPWRIRYKGWVITHDPFRHMACYREDGPDLIWCYFGCSLDVIKFTIDQREYLARKGNN